MNTDKTYAEKVAAEYAPKETSKVVALKKLDRKAKMGANIFGYTFGIVMALLLGVGMCLSLKARYTSKCWMRNAQMTGIFRKATPTTRFFPFRRPSRTSIRWWLSSHAF